MLFLLYCFIVLRHRLSTYLCGSTTHHLPPSLFRSCGLVRFIFAAVRRTFSFSLDKLLLRAFSLVHSLRSGPSLQHSIKACRGQRPRTPGVFQYRGFCLILIHSTNSFNFFFKLPQALHKQLHRSPTQLN